MDDGRERKALRLRIRDAEDLRVASAVLQDALAAVHDMAYLPREKRFVMIANRFCWEQAPEPLAAESEDEETADASFAEAGASAVYERVNCGLVFDHVRRVRLSGFALGDRARILELLALSLAGNRLLMTFAGGAAVELTVSRLCCHLEDLGQPWPTLRRPSHPDLES